MSINFEYLKEKVIEIPEKIYFFTIKKEKKKMCCYLMRIFFDQSSPVHPISEYRGVRLSVTAKPITNKERKSLYLIFDAQSDLQKDIFFYTIKI